MKVLTVRQPWAQLIAVGAKDIENRNWHTNVRGRIAIHSSAAYRRADIEDACELMRRFIPRFSDRRFKSVAENYPTGVILATVEIVDCVTHSESPWFTGDYGLVLRDAKMLAEPIQAKGKLGWWDHDVPFSEDLNRCYRRSS